MVLTWIMTVNRLAADLTIVKPRLEGTSQTAEQG